MEEKLKQFILEDSQFLEYAKKYSFMYREFSPLVDYFEVSWNRKEKKWECEGEGYCCLNQNEEIPQKKNSLLLDLCIEGYNWGTLFNKMEQEFTENLKEEMGEEEISELVENDYERYVELREEFFNINKQKIIKEWFELKEDNLQTYFQNQFNKLKELLSDKKRIVY
jgi:hypothetical protein